MSTKRIVLFVLLALVQAVVFVWGLYLGITEGVLSGYLSAAAMALAFAAMAYDRHKIRIKKRFEKK